MQTRLFSQWEKKLRTPASSNNAGTNQEFCDTLAGFFQEKVANIFDKFTTHRAGNYQEEHVPTGLANKISLASFKVPWEEELIESILLIKSGAPQDPCPPNIMHMIPTQVVQNLGQIFDNMFTERYFPSH